jgi:hypothetical protein
MLALVEDRCTVCAERTIGSKIGAWFAPNVPLAQKLFWTHPMVFVGDVAQVEAHFGLFGDGAILRNHFGCTR